MLAEKAEPVPTTVATHRATFFRQSGWMMVASVASGAFMWGVHPLSKKIPATEYGIVLALLAATMCIPTIPLQMVFAQQTAADLTINRQSQLAGKIRLAWLGTFGLWLVLAVLVGLKQDYILALWKISNPAALLVTVVGILCSLWMPLFQGVLQGKQDFLWLGWSIILNGVVRLGGAALIVLALSGYAAGIMTGVVAGMAVALGVAIWRSRELWLGPVERFDWRRLLAQVVPVMLGFGACQFVFTADTMFVKAYFTGQETAFYGAAGTLSRALVWVVGPLTAVMFPKIVHSTAKAEKLNLLGLTLLCTAVLAVGGALGLCVLGPWLLKFVWKANYVGVGAAVLPWYAAAMVPLALANVLVNNLLARSQYRIVPILAMLAIAYGLTLTRLHGSLVIVLQILGIFNLLLLVLCAWFTWGTKFRVSAADANEPR